MLPDNPTSSQPGFTGIAVTPGAVVLTLQTEAGKTYHLLCSSTLTNWSESSNFVSGGTSTVLTNPISPSGGIQFFHAWTQKS